jgi:hypothetical protein
MNPDQIKSFIENNYPEILSERRRNPDGWAFYLGRVQKGSGPTRIARVVQIRPGSPVRFKPALSARVHKSKGLEVEIKGGAAQVRQLMDAELNLWHRHFA